MLLASFAVRYSSLLSADAEEVGGLAGVPGKQLHDLRFDFLALPGFHLLAIEVPGKSKLVPDRCANSTGSGRSPGVAWDSPAATTRQPATPSFPQAERLISTFFPLYTSMMSVTDIAETTSPAFVVDV